MPKLPDDFTDELFQQGAERYDFPYKPEAWEHMEGLLENHHATRRRQRLGYSALLLLSLLLLTALFYQYGPVAAVEVDQESTLEATHTLTEALTREGTSSGTSASAKTLAAQPLEANPEQEIALTVTPSTAKTAQLDATTTSGASTKARAAAKTQRQSALDQNSQRSGKTDRVGVEKSTTNDQTIPTTSTIGAHASSSSSIDTQPKASEVPSTLPSSSTDQKASVAVRTASSPSNPTRQLSESSANSQTLVVDKSRAGTVVPAEETLASTLLPVAWRPLAPIALDLSTTRPELPPLAGPTTAATEAMQSFPRFSALVYGGIVSGNTENGGPGMLRTRMGLALSYRLANRWSLSTGAGLNNLCYLTDGKEYKISRPGWWGGATPKSIEAQCRILEIPLEITYHFNDAGKSGAYVRAGITSYLMLRENYAYEYPAAEDLPPTVNVANLRLDWEERNTNQHFFGSAQVTGGYEFRRSSGSSYRLEAFAGAPLSGIGHGDVRVWTFGLTGAFGLNIGTRR